MINERYQSNARAYPGADANSDHTAVIANIKIHLRVLKRLKQKPSFLLDSLKNAKINTNFSKTALENFPKYQAKENFHNQWINPKMSIITAANKLISKESKIIKQPHCVTDEIINLLHKRRETKSDPENYSMIQKEIQK